MQHHIRKATKEDVPQILDLITELAVFEKEPDAVEVTIDELKRDGFGVNPLYVCLVAESEGQIDGLALMYYRYSTWKGKVIHLEDLIVNEKSRGQGLGTKLLDEVVRYGKSKGVKRISWEVLDWNTPAIEFYEKKGANVMRDWHVVQLDEEGIEGYLRNKGARE